MLGHGRRAIGVFGEIKQEVAGHRASEIVVHHHLGDGELGKVDGHLRADEAQVLAGRIVGGRHLDTVVIVANDHLEERDIGRSTGEAQKPGAVVAACAVIAHVIRCRIGTVVLVLIATTKTLVVETGRARAVHIGHARHIDRTNHIGNHRLHRQHIARRVIQLDVGQLTLAIIARFKVAEPGTEVVDRLGEPEHHRVRRDALVGSAKRNRVPVQNPVGVAGEGAALGRAHQ